jgi:hypothetical protein
MDTCTHPCTHHASLARTPAWCVQVMRVVRANDGVVRAIDGVMRANDGMVRAMVRASCIRPL